MTLGQIVPRYSEVDHLGVRHASLELGRECLVVVDSPTEGKGIAEDQDPTLAVGVVRKVFRAAEATGVGMNRGARIILQFVDKNDVGIHAPTAVRVGSEYSAVDEGCSHGLGWSLPEDAGAEFEESEQHREDHQAVTDTSAEGSRSSSGHGRTALTERVIVPAGASGARCLVFTGIAVPGTQGFSASRRWTDCSRSVSGRGSVLGLTGREQQSQSPPSCVHPNTGQPATRTRNSRRHRCVPA